MEDEGRQLIRYGGSFFVVTFLTKQMGHTQPNDPGNKKEYKPPPPPQELLSELNKISQVKSLLLAYSSYHP